METRRLGYMESYMFMVQKHLYGSTQICAIAQIEGFMSADVFKKALAIAFNSQPLLRAKIIEPSEEDAFFELSSKFADIPIKVLPRKDAFAWQKQSEAEMQSVLPYDKYLWRATLLLNEDENKGCHEMIMTLNHIIADGISIAHFFDDFLKICADLISGKEPTVTTFVLHPPTEVLIAKNITWQDYVNYKSSAMAQIPNVTTWSYETYKPIGERMTRHIFKVIGAEEVSALRIRAKQEQVTVNAALNAALMLSAERQAQKTVGFNLLSMVDMRPRCQPPVEPNYLGCYYGSIGTHHTEVGSNTLFWDLARAYKKNFTECSEKQLYAPIEFPYSAVTELVNKVVISKNQTFNMGFGCSNLGVIDYPDSYGPFKLNAMYFSTCRQAGNFAILLHLATVHGQMFATFAYVEPLLSKNWAENFVAAYLDILKTNL